MNGVVILTLQFAAQEAFGIAVGRFFGASGEWSEERKQIARFLRARQRRPSVERRPGEILLRAKDFHQSFA
jgi:hypothetical protein